jgi:hypothetical protein
LAAIHTERLRRLSELYVWLAFILSVYYLQSLATAVAEWSGSSETSVFRSIAVAHLAVVCAALWTLGAWSAAVPSRLAAGLFIVGAVVFWVGARTFPGLALDRVAANLPGHLWTSVNFLLATIITLVGLALLTLVLREAGDRVLSAVGLLLFGFGSVFWVLHLAFRMTIVVQAAEAWSASAAAPDWFEPWSAWAALLFGIYSVLAYIGLAAYGGALLSVGWQRRWLGWTCVFAGLVAAPLGGLPLFIHVPLWLIGLMVLTDRSSPATAPQRLGAATAISS